MIMMPSLPTPKTNFVGIPQGLSLLSEDIKTDRDVPLRREEE